MASRKPAPPSLYAEFLPKLGRISIVVHLPSLSTYRTKALISADATRLIVDHEGVTTELTLPVKSSLSGEHLPGEIPPGLEEMSWRLTPHPDELPPDRGRLVFRGDAVPWSAADLKPCVDVMCRECKAVIVSKDKLREWKDLPSENWAEMMEFWHCHKPITNGHTKANGTNGQGTVDKTQASDNELASRSYGANSAIVAQEGVGFVDLTKMLFHGEDWKNLMVSDTQAPPASASPSTNDSPHTSAMAIHPSEALHSKHALPLPLICWQWESPSLCFLTFNKHTFCATRKYCPSRLRHRSSGIKKDTRRGLTLFNAFVHRYKCPRANIPATRLAWSKLSRSSRTLV